MESAKSYQLSAISILLMMAAAMLPALGSPFADTVVSWNPGPGQFVGNPLYNDPARCLGAPHGLYVDEPDLTSLVTLGDGGRITLAFNDAVHDDPRNPYGLDFIVFSNASFVGGDPYHRWQELAFVEISQNGTVWYLILPSKLPADLVGGTDTGQSYTIVSGYAECTPTVGLPQDLEMPAFAVTRTPEELYTIPERPSVEGDDGTIWFDYVSGGGDGLDIAKAVVQTSPGVPALDGQGKAIPANLSWFRYVRITDAKTGDFIPNLGEISAEIDAVADVRPALTVGEAKKLPEGGYALIAGAVVTAMFPYGFFIESPDRSAAIEVSTDQYVLPGDVLTLTGRLHRSGGSFVLEDVMFTATSSGADVPKPLGMPIKTLASDMAYGLRVRTWGVVVDEGDGTYIVISDGASSAEVSCPAGVSRGKGQFVTVTGICDREEGSPSTVVRVNDPIDIQSTAQ